MKHERQPRIARRRARAKFNLVIHLVVFIAVNALLVAVNQRASPDLHWHLFPLGGWAVALTIHGLAVFLSGSGLRERMVEDELRKLETNRAPGAH